MFIAKDPKDFFDVVALHREDMIIARVFKDCFVKLVGDEITQYYISTDHKKALLDQAKAIAQQAGY